MVVVVAFTFKDKDRGIECPRALAHPMTVTVVDLGDVMAGGDDIRWSMLIDHLF